MDLQIACPKCGAQLTSPEDRPKMVVVTGEQVEMNCEVCSGTFKVHISIAERT